MKHVLRYLLFLGGGLAFFDNAQASNPNTTLIQAAEKQAFATFGKLRDDNYAAISKATIDLPRFNKYSTELEKLARKGNAKAARLVEQAEKWKESNPNLRLPAGTRDKANASQKTKDGRRLSPKEQHILKTWSQWQSWADKHKGDRALNLKSPESIVLLLRDAEQALENRFQEVRKAFNTLKGQNIDETKTKQKLSSISQDVQAATNYNNNGVNPLVSFLKEYETFNSNARAALKNK